MSIQSKLERIEQRMRMNHNDEYLFLIYDYGDCEGMREPLPDESNETYRQYLASMGIESVLIKQPNGH